MTGMTMVVMTIQKIIYMEAAPFEFYLEEKMKLIEYTNLLRTVS